MLISFWTPSDLLTAAVKTNCSLIRFPPQSQTISSKPSLYPSSTAHGNSFRAAKGHLVRLSLVQIKKFLTFYSFSNSWCSLQSTGIGIEQTIIFMLSYIFKTKLNFSWWRWEHSSYFWDRKHSYRCNCCYWWHRTANILQRVEFILKLAPKNPIENHFYTVWEELPWDLHTDVHECHSPHSVAVFHRIV